MVPIAEAIKRRTIIQIPTLTDEKKFQILSISDFLYVCARLAPPSYLIANSLSETSSFLLPIVRPQDSQRTV
ncbi:hypothetical protein ACEF17_13260, partial [Streptococcus hyovaginalis]